MTPIPTNPATVPARPTHSAVVDEKCNVTCFEVGTTTMKFGVARYGPSPPSTCQLGNHDSLTMTGTPVRETSNEIDVSLL